MHRCTAILFLSLCLARPIVAQDQGNRTYVDKKHNDSHQWNDEENRNYHQYLTERHKPEHDFSKASKREQQDYWNWRHQHMDEHH